MEKKIVNLNVRMPADLHDRVKGRSVRDMRSLNLEILWLLGLALDAVEQNELREGGQRKPPAPPDPA